MAQTGKMRHHTETRKNGILPEGLQLFAGGQGGEGTGAGPRRVETAAVRTTVCLPGPGRSPVPDIRSPYVPACERCAGGMERPLACREALLPVSADIRLVAGVGPHVAGQLDGLGKHSITVLAGIHFPWKYMGVY